MIFTAISDQVYNPQMQDPRSDQAVVDTAGVYVVSDPGVAQETQYCAKCGRSDCAYCSQLVPKLTQVYPGRMCQYGANFMASQGSSHIDILKLYYGVGTKFSDDHEEVIMPDVTLIPTDVLTKYNLTVTPATGPHFKLIHIEHYDTNKNGSYPGMHNVFMTVSDKAGARINKIQLKITNANGEVTYAAQDKPANEPGTNVVLNPGDLLSITVDGATSDTTLG